MYPLFQIGLRGAQVECADVDSARSIMDNLSAWQA